VLAKLKELVVDKIRAVASSASDKNVRKKKFEEVLNDLWVPGSVREVSKERARSVGNRFNQ
jgi:hypothetical protein